MGKKVCMLSSNHSLFDDRIYWKEAVSLKEAGYEVCHIGIGDEEFSGVSPEGIRLLQLKRSPSNKLLTLTGHKRNNYSRLLAAAKKEKADIYTFHDWQINLIGHKLKKLPHSPKVIYDVLEATANMLRSDIEEKGWLTKMVFAPYIKMIELWELRCARQYDEIITCEDKVADHFEQTVPREKISCIHNYSSLDPDHYASADSAKLYDVIYSGGVVPQKGIRELIDSIALVKKLHPDVKALIIGPVLNNAFRDLIQDKIKKLDLQQNVILHDPVPFAGIHRYYLQCRMGMCNWYPNRKNSISIPVKIFEYMAMGLPVIMTEKGVAAVYINEYRTGLLVNPYSPREIADAILRLLKDRSLYDQLSRNGTRAVREKYNWQKEKPRFLEVFARL